MAHAFGSQISSVTDASPILRWVPSTPAPSRRPFVLSLRETIPTPREAFESAIGGFQGTAPEISPPSRWPCVTDPEVPSKAGTHECESEPPSCASLPPTPDSCPHEAAEGPSARAKVKRSRRHDTPVEASLRSHLSELDGVSTNQIFLVRKIQKLRLGSQETIREHFSMYGKVDAVLVAHSHVMSSCRRFVRRMRPSNLAIVIMASEEAATVILSTGENQVIDGVSVLVEHFQRRSPMQCDQEVAEGQRSSCQSRYRDISASGGCSVGAPSFADSKTTVGSNASTGDSDNAISDESDNDCHLPSDFEYYPTDDEGF